MRAGLLLLLLSLLAPGAERKPVFPPDVKPVGPYSPGILTGSFLYVSGQGAQKPGAGLVSGVPNQTRQCLENVRAVVEAAGLTMEHVVYTQVYMIDLSRYDEMNEAYAAFFPKDPPARAVVGVARMPLDTPVEISAVAVRNLADKQRIEVRGMLPGAAASPMIRAAGRVYMSGVMGRNADRNRVPEKAADQVGLALRNSEMLLKRAGHKLRDLAVATVYVTDNLPRELVELELRKRLAGYQLVPVDALPFRANIEITGIVARDLVVRDGAGDTATVLKSFEDLSSAVASNVYIDAIDNFATMNKAYASSFSAAPPTRTTVQPLKAGQTNRFTILLEK